LLLSWRAVFALVDQVARHFQVGPIVTGLIFAALLMIPLFFIQLPFAVYETFVIEERYGFNRMTIGYLCFGSAEKRGVGRRAGRLGVGACFYGFLKRPGSWAWVYALAGALWISVVPGIYCAGRPS